MAGRTPSPHQPYRGSPGPWVQARPADGPAEGEHVARPVEKAAAASLIEALIREQGE